MGHINSRSNVMVLFLGFSPFLLASPSFSKWGTLRTDKHVVNPINLQRRGTPKNLDDMTNLGEETASTCQPSLNQRHRVCRGTWSIWPWTWQHPCSSWSSRNVHLFFLQWEGSPWSRESASAAYWKTTQAHEMLESIESDILIWTK